MVLNLTYETVSTSGPLGRRAITDAVSRAGVETEELRANAVVLETGAGAPANMFRKMHIISEKFAFGTVYCTHALISN